MTERTSDGLRLVHEHELDLRISYGGQELARYVYRPRDAQLESPRPYFHPVRTLAGDVVSLFRPHDHVWHEGIALSLPNVGRPGSPGAGELLGRGHVPARPGIPAVGQQRVDPPSRVHRPDRLAEANPRRPPPKLDHPGWRQLVRRTPLVHCDGRRRRVGSGLPEAGDAVFTFPPDVLADQERYRAAAALPASDDDAMLAEAARTRRDLAIEGYLPLRDRVRAGDFTGLDDLHRAAAGLVQDLVPRYGMCGHLNT